MSFASPNPGATFNVEAEGNALVIKIGPVDPMNGGFVGTIESTQYGTGQIGGNWIDNSITGGATLDGHTASFGAQVNGKSIAGTISVGWFWKVNFTGVEAA